MKHTHILKDGVEISEIAAKFATERTGRVTLDDLHHLGEMCELIIGQRDHALGMLTAFRHAANSIAIEAGVIPTHIDHDEAGKSVLQDIYFLQLIAEAELRMRTLSTGYERLRAAASKVLPFEAPGAGVGSGGCCDPRIALEELREVLNDDLK